MLSKELSIVEACARDYGGIHFIVFHRDSGMAEETSRSNDTTSRPESAEAAAQDGSEPQAKRNQAHGEAGPCP